MLCANASQKARREERGGGGYQPRGVADSRRGFSVPVVPNDPIVTAPNESEDKSIRKHDARSQRRSSVGPVSVGRFPTAAEDRGILLSESVLTRDTPGDDSGHSHSHSAGDERPAATGHRRPEQCEYSRWFPEDTVGAERQTIRPRRLRLATEG